MKNLLKTIAVGLALTSLGYAADNKSGGVPGFGDLQTSGSGGAKTGTPPATTPSQPDKNTDIRTGGSTTPQPNVSNDTSATGTVQSIDRSANRVRVRDSQGNVTEFNITGQTEFMSNGRTVPFTQVQPGETIIINNGVRRDSTTVK